jgi:hypothetical protein
LQWPEHQQVELQSQGRRERHALVERMKLMPGQVAGMLVQAHAAALAAHAELSVVRVVTADVCSDACSAALAAAAEAAAAATATAGKRRSKLASVWQPSTARVSCGAKPFMAVAHMERQTAATPSRWHDSIYHHDILMCSKPLEFTICETGALSPQQCC